MMLCYFFFKQKTAYEMRISDWSSDVCSSDLILYDSDMPLNSGRKMRALKLAPIILAIAFVAAKDGVSAPAPPPLPLATAATAAYPSDAAMLRGEFDRLRRSIAISTGGSIYAAYQLGRTLARATFANDDSALKRDLVANAAQLIRGDRKSTRLNSSN